MSLTSSTKTPLLPSIHKDGKVPGSIVSKHQQGAIAASSTASEDGLSSLSSYSAKAGGGALKGASSLQKEVKILSNSMERRMTGLSNSTTKEFSVNKLRFEQLELVGRDEEKTILSKRLESLVSNIKDMSNNDKAHENMGVSGSKLETTHSAEDATVVGHRELIMISGVSGSGKSALAMTLKDQLHKAVLPGGKRGVCVRSKFDLKASENAYSTLITACGDLALAIQGLREEDSQAGKQAFQDIQAKLRRELVGMELRILVHAVPALADILVVDSNDNIDYNNNQLIRMGSSNKKLTRVEPKGRVDQETLTGQTKELLESAFKKFFRAVSLCFAPLILTLDDLQWADNHTLALLERILSDKTNPHIMIVGIYRSNEVDQTHSLSKMMRNLKQTQTEHIGLHITEVHIDNLGPNESHQILMALLNTDDQAKTQPLADLCHKKTLGNPFFFLLYVDTLQGKGLLSFNFGTFDWQWDISLIQAEAGATANVVEFMIEKINNCSDELVHLLKLACCLGNAFTGAVLFMVWALTPEVTMLTGGEGGTDESKDVIFKKLLDNCVAEKFLEHCDEGLRWCHDKVQEAAMLLEPEDVFAPRQYQVGQTLYSCLDEHDLEDALFCVVDLLNAGPREESKERALMNLRAAKKAKVFGALNSQASYSDSGLNLLPHDCWVSCKELALELYTHRAEAASNTGDFSTMERYCGVVFAIGECSIVEKMPAYQVWIDYLSRHNRVPEALTLALDVLGKLGCKLPRSKLSQTLKAIPTLLRFKRGLAKNTPTMEELNRMPVVTDPIHKQTMTMLISTAYHAYLIRNKMLWLLGTIRMVQMTIRHGLTDESQFAFVSAGILITHALGDWKTGPKYVLLGLAMYERLPQNQRTNRSSALSTSAAIVSSWVKPAQGQLRDIMDAYKSGMELGKFKRSLNRTAFRCFPPLANSNPSNCYCRQR